MAGTFASDEYTDREEGYWDKYRDRIAAVSKDDVLRVAQKHLHPDRLVILGVGDVAEMLAGNPDKPDRCRTDLRFQRRRTAGRERGVREFFASHNQRRTDCR